MSEGTLGVKGKKETPKTVNPENETKSELTVRAFNEVKDLRAKIKELEARIQEKGVTPATPPENESKEIKWNKSWTYSGPQHIPDNLKDPRFDYGWVDYQSSGKLSAAQRQHWEVDREIRKKLGEGYTLPTLDHSIPIEGALIVGSSLLVRRLKEIGKQIFVAEQALVPEPRTVAKARLQAEIGSDVQLVGDVRTRI